MKTLYKIALIAIITSLASCENLKVEKRTYTFEEGGELNYPLFEAAYRLKLLTGESKITDFVEDGRIYHLVNYPPEVLDPQWLKDIRGKGEQF